VKRNTTLWRFWCCHLQRFAQFAALHYARAPLLRRQTLQVRALWVLQIAITTSPTDHGRRVATSVKTSGNNPVSVISRSDNRVSSSRSRDFREPGLRGLRRQTAQRGRMI
jgi:hypothetical protein